MNLKTPREAFLHRLQLVSALCPARSLKPIYKDVLLTVEDGKVQLVATNGDVSLRTRYEAEGIEGNGRAALPAATLLAAVKSLLSDEISITEKGGLHELSGGSSVFKLVGDDPALFPEVPEVDVSNAIEVPLEAFLDLCSRTMFAAAKDMGRYAFNGVLVELSPEDLTLVATDGRRLSLARKDCATGVKERTSRIVSLEGLVQLQRAAAEDDGASLAVELGDNTVSFAVGSSEVVAQLVEGEFPDFRAVLPKEKDTPCKVQLSRDEFERAVKRAAVTAGEEARAVEIGIDKGRLSVSSRQEGLGEARSEVDVEYEGDAVGIRFNPEFLGEYLRTLSEDDVSFHFKDRSSAGYFKSNDGAVYVLMPITS